MKSFETIEQILFSNLEGANLKENFRIGLEGASHGHFEGSNTCNSSEDVPIKWMRDEPLPDGMVKYYTVAEPSLLEIAVTYRQAACGAIRQTVCAKNISDSPVTLNHLSSTALSGIGLDGLLKWHDPKRYILHTCDMAWEGECQWRHRTLSEVGLVPTTTHANTKTVRVESIGSWTTARNYPILILEDTETGKSIYLESEPAGAWEIELFNYCSDFWDFGADGSIGVEINCACIHHDGWQVTLLPGECYTTQPCIYGAAEGGFDEAIAALIRCKRADSLVRFEDGKLPVVFNCYMNCIFGSPTAEKLIPLIDAAAEMGCDVFCIDAGWYQKEKNGLTDVGLGDYEIDETLFAGYGLKGIFDYMLSKGLKPGIWIEMEACQECDAYHLAPNCLCERNGKPIGYQRAFFNLRESSVQTYLMELIDRLYAMGVRYIKNDYNRTTGIGFSNYGESYSKENTDALLAFLSFIDAVKAKYPDLILENCGSGGMREDHNTLRHFDLQSTSDQELYYRNPSIVSGSLACMAPEKAGAWAYPYPIFLNGEQKKSFSDPTLWEAKRAAFANGEETAFNMVTAMLANLYLSGRIDQCDAHNAELIRSGVALYHSYSSFVQSAIPIWPTGTFTIDAEGVFTTGLYDPEKRKLLLAVWNIRAWKPELVIDLSKWVPKNATASCIYPCKASNMPVDACFYASNRKLSVRLPEGYSARLFELTW